MTDWWSKTKAYAWDAKKSYDDRLEMEGLLKQARKSLQQYFAHTPQKNMLNAEERISKKILRQARGIAFITELKGGFIFGAKGGSGIIICRTDDISSAITVQKTKFRPWSPPCAVGSGGLSAGFIAGITKIDHIIILPTQTHVDIFMGDGQLQIKSSADMHLYKYGRNADAGLGVSNKFAIAPILSYSFGVKGLFAGISLDGEVITTRGYCNEVYYGKKVTVKDILTSTTKSNDNGMTYKPNGKARILTTNRDYETLIQMLNDYCIDENLDNNNYVPPSISSANNSNNNSNSNSNDLSKPLNGNLNKNKKKKKKFVNGGNAHVSNSNAKNIQNIQNGNMHAKNVKNIKKNKKKRWNKNDFNYDNDNDNYDDVDLNDNDNDDNKYNYNNGNDINDNNNNNNNNNNDNNDNDDDMELDYNQDNLGNNSNAQIWNNKVY